MTPKAELLELIEKLPDDKIAQAIDAINALLALQQPGGNKQAAQQDAEQPLNDLLTAIIGSVTNSFYDLSVENERAGAKIIAKRLDFSRTRILEAWDAYKKSRPVDISKQ